MLCSCGEKERDDWLDQFSLCGLQHHLLAGAASPHDLGDAGDVGHGLPVFCFDFPIMILMVLGFSPPRILHDDLSFKGVKVLMVLLFCNMT